MVITVQRVDDNNYLVIIKELVPKGAKHRGVDKKGAAQYSETRHHVSLSDDYRQILCDNKLTKREIIKRAFEFLLKRESKESILPAFNLPVINRFFPDFENIFQRA